MELAKFFEILVGQGEGAPPLIANAATGTAVSTESRPQPATRYAYYRRCQHFRRNGEQCKAPAMKGESICYRHAEQMDMERRRKEQRREILSRSGLGLATADSIQRTIAAVILGLYQGSLDQKTAGPLMIEIQTAIRLQKMMARLARKFKARALAPTTPKPGSASLA